MRVGLEPTDHVVHGVGVLCFREGLRILYDVREGEVCRYPQGDLNVTRGAHTPAAERIRGQTGP